MAGEEAAWKSRDTQRWESFWASFARRLLARWGLSIGLTSFFFFLTVLVYYLTNSRRGKSVRFREKRTLNLRLPKLNRKTSGLPPDQVTRAPALAG